MIKKHHQYPQASIIQEYHSYDKHEIKKYNRKFNDKSKSQPKITENSKTEVFNGIECILDRNIQTSFPINSFFLFIRSGAIL